MVGPLHQPDQGEQRADRQQGEADVGHDDHGARSLLRRAAMAGAGHCTGLAIGVGAEGPRPPSPRGAGPRPARRRDRTRRGSARTARPVAPPLLIVRDRRRHLDRHRPRGQGDGVGHERHDEGRTHPQRHRHDGELDSVGGGPAPAGPRSRSTRPAPRRSRRRSGRWPTAFAADRPGPVPARNSDDDHGADDQTGDDVADRRLTPQRAPHDRRASTDQAGIRVASLTAAPPGCRPGGAAGPRPPGR